MSGRAKGLRLAMDKPEGYDDAVDDKRSAVKVILLGDSAVGKTKSAPVAPDSCFLRFRTWLTDQRAGLSNAS